MWVEGVWCQKLQPSGKLGRLFEVSQPADAQEPVDDDDREMRQAVELSLTQATADLDAEEKKRRAQIEADNDRFEFSAWLDRAGWARHLKGLDREWLSTLTHEPKQQERGLARVCWAARMVIWKAQQASKPGVVGLAAMNYINRREMGNNTNEKPFNARQTATTMDKYSGWWLEVIRYIWRTHALPEVEYGEEDEVVEGMRPPYQLTGQQSVLLQSIQSVVGEDGEDEDEDWFDADESEEELEAEEEEKAEELVLTFMLALLDHPLGDNEYTSALLSGMAVLGIDAQCGWVSPLVYTPKQAAIVGVSRMLVLYRSTQLRKQRIAELRAEGGNYKAAADTAPGHFHFVREMANQFMTLTSYDGEPTPMDSIQRLKAYGMKIRFTTNAEGVVDWVDDTLLYSDIRFSMPQLRSMIHGMIASARHRLLEGLMLLQVDEEGGIMQGKTGLPAIHWDRLVDNPAERRTGWSFMDDARNKTATEAQNPPEWLGQRVGQERRLRDIFIDVAASREAIAGGQGPVWRAEAVARYRRAMKTTRRDLAALVHMTGGLPARASELITIQFMNSANGDGRGVFIEDGLVVFVTAYHKNIGSTGKSKVIHRYLPREVGELVVYYLWFALPFWKKLERASSGKPVTNSAYIWEPEPEKAWLMPQRKRRASDASSQAKRRRLDAGLQGNAPDGREDVEAEVEPPPERPVEVELWNSNRVRYAMQKASLEYMGVKLNIMAWRHGTKAIYRKYIGSAVKAFVQGDEDDSGDEDEAFDVQAGHSSSVGGMIYGRPITEGMFSTEAKRWALRRVSLEWHSFLQVPSAMEAKPKRGTRAAAARKEATEEEYRRWKMMRHVDVEEELRRMVGGQAQFRSVQRPALQAIMQHKSPVVAIMGTGAGKSILFMLPASVSSGVTVVVVPLVSLREDMKARCDKLGITCVEWSSRRPHEWAQVVLVTPESAVGEAFGHFINRQRAMGRLDRIVVDECHVVLDSLQGWRGQMLALRGLVTVETQMVYLTATLRPSEEQQFIDLMGLPGKEQCAWFRGVTSRSNVQYQIHAYDMEEEEEAVSRLVEELKQKYPSPGQVIVYCDTVQKTVRLAEVLGCVCYHRNVGSSQEKKALVAQLTSGQQQVFTATNALGLGVDAPTIRAVVHVGLVRSVRQYAQESGRAGRDRLASEAIIMRGFRETRRGRIPRSLGEDVEPEMKELMDGVGCMREVLDEAMDGRGDREGCQEGEEACQRCRALRSGEAESDEEVGMTPPAQVEEERERAEFEQQLSVRRIRAVHEAACQGQGAIEVEELVHMMEEWKAGCQRCRAWGVRGRDHDIWTCEREGAKEIQAGMEAFEKMKRWALYSCCFPCGLPQAVCQSFEMDITTGGYRKQRGVECQFAGVLVATVMAIWVRHPQIFGDMVEAAMAADGWVAQTEQEREEGPGFTAIGQWFGKKTRWGGVEANKMSWFIVQVGKEIE
jgi:superfamily II DNA helicase RecQ